MSKKVTCLFLYIICLVATSSLLQAHAVVTDNDSAALAATRITYVPYVIALQSGLDALLANESICCSTLDNQGSSLAGIATQNLQAEQVLASSLDLCCSSIDQQFALVQSKIDAIHLVASIDASPITSALSSCCSALDNQLAFITSQIDSIPTANIELIASKIDNCSSAIESQLQVMASNGQTIGSSISTIESLIEVIPTVDTVPLTSNLEVCCSTIESSLQNVSTNDQLIANTVSSIESMLEAVPTADITPSTSRLDTCCSTIESQLSSLNAQKLQQLSSNQAVASTLDVCCSTIETQLGSMSGLLASSLDTVQGISSKEDVYSSVIEMQLGSISGQLSQTVSTNQSISSKLDTYNSFIDAQLSAIESMLTSCTVSSITGATTLATPGVYTLCADSAGTYTISGSDITFDLNNHTISGGLYGIAVSGKNVTVRNGTIKNALAAGIVLTGTQCLVRSCELIGSPTGMQITNSGGNMIDACKALRNTQAGYSLLNSYTNLFTNCSVLNASGSADTYGFYANGGAQNSFNKCLVNSVTSTGGQAIGYGLYAETGDKVLNSQAYNCIASTTGFANGAVLGILPQSLAAIVSGASYGAFAYGVAWSPDGRYIAVAGGISSAAATLNIYSFNGISITAIASVAYDVSGSVIRAISWSPDGRYIAIGGDPVTASGRGFVICEFTGASLTLLSSTYTGDRVANFNSIAWSPDGRYLAVGVTTSSVYYTKIYAFDGSALITVYSASQTNAVSGLSWSADGNYLAVCSGSLLNVFSFDGYRLQVAAFLTGNGTTQVVSWSPNGRYLAMGTSGRAVTNMRIYAFSGSSITTVTGDLPGGRSIYGISWSPDGRYLAVTTYTLNTVRLYAFDGQLIRLISSFTASSPIVSVQGSPNGNYLLFGTNNGLFYLLSTGTGCAQCAIENNSFEGASNGVGMGTSYAANTSANLLVNNRAVANNVNLAAPSQTTAYGDMQYLQTLAAAMWRLAV